MNTKLVPTQYDTASPAHLGWRMLAIVYDALPMIPLLLVSSLLMLLLHQGRPATPGSLWAFFTIFVYWCVIGTYAVISWRRGGQTMGMRPWRLLVTTNAGKNAAFNTLCLRYAIVSFSAGLALLWCLFDRQKRGLHDIATKTLLVRKQPNASVETEKNLMSTK